MDRTYGCKYCGSNDIASEDTTVSTYRATHEGKAIWKRVTYKTLECRHCDMLSKYVIQVEYIYPTHPTDKKKDDFIPF